MKQSLPGLARCQISTIQRVVSDSQKVDAAKWASRLSSRKIYLFLYLHFIGYDCAPQGLASRVGSYSARLYPMRRFSDKRVTVRS